MIAELKEGGFFVGCVIDEAHLNFGTSARAAASFYVNHLAPDATLLATATPNDHKLSAFLRAADRQLIDANRVEVARSAVVAAGLNRGA